MDLQRTPDTHVLLTTKTTTTSYWHIVAIFDYNIEDNNDKIRESVTGDHHSVQKCNNIDISGVGFPSACLNDFFFLPRVSLAPRKRTTTKCCRKLTLTRLASVDAVAVFVANVLQTTIILLHAPSVRLLLPNKQIRRVYENNNAEVTRTSNYVSRLLREWLIFKLRIRVVIAHTCSVNPTPKS